MIELELPRVPGGFQTILADPPWSYSDSLPGPKRGAAKFYDTMSIEEICALPVGEITAPNAHLYLWVTNSFLREAFDVLDAWGFTFKQKATWCKVTRDGRPRIGMGRHFRNATEDCYFAVKGRLAPLDRSIPNYFTAERTVHSAKPPEFYDIIRRLSPGPRLEMFARNAAEGFAAWGLEAPSA